jgi:hypothetical protein
MLLEKHESQVVHGHHEHQEPGNAIDNHVMGGKESDASFASLKGKRREEESGLAIPTPKSTKLIKFAINRRSLLIVQRAG